MLYSAGEFDEARSLYAALAAADTADLGTTGMLALLAVRQGRAQEADSLIAVLRAYRRPYRFGRPLYWLARVAGLRDDRTGVIELLRQANREGYSRISQLHLEPEFAPILDYPPFRDFIRPTPARGR